MLEYEMNVAIEQFLSHYEKDFREAARKGRDSIEVDFNYLSIVSPELDDMLLANPEEVLEAMMDATSDVDIPEGSKKFTLRFKNLPITNQIRIRNLRSKHLGKLITIDGVVRRASEVKPEISIITYQCPMCDEEIEVVQKDRTITKPNKCSNPDCRVRSGFMRVDKKLFDARWLSIEEPFEVATSERPGQVSVYLKGDLTTPEMQKRTDPGQRVKVTGILKEMKKNTKGKEGTQLDIYMEANHIQPAELEWDEVHISEEDEKRIKELASSEDVYEKVSGSIAPSIYGLKEVKKAVMYQMFGGVEHKLPDGSKIRGDIHVLLIGDPSTGKSQILKMISSIIPRGKYVGGSGATKAGLTATVVKDDDFMGGWVLEAGAMVLANKGILAIDEFDKMNKDDVIAMHEALEQQTVSVAKANICATLPAKVSVLAGANPKLFRFDEYKGIAEQTDIPDTLLGRFDLKFALKDNPDEEKDRKLALHVIKTRLNPNIIKPEIEPKFLRKYIAYARNTCQPQMSDEAAEVLMNFYLTMRKLTTSHSKSIAITLRQNEGLMRLAEASAKIRLSPMVEIEDAKRAIEVMEYSLKQLGYDYETGQFDVDKSEGMSSSRRSKINTLMDIIDMLSSTYDNVVPRNEIINMCEEKGLEPRKTEEMIRKMMQDGSLTEPKIGFIKRLY